MKRSPVASAASVAVSDPGPYLELSCRQPHQLGRGYRVVIHFGAEHRLEPGILGSARDILDLVGALPSTSLRVDLDQSEAHSFHHVTTSRHCLRLLRSYTVGLMFWLRRNRFDGSYLFFSATSRS
jgi:hypothetical protein